MEKSDKHQVDVEGYMFDISDAKTVRLVTASNKFWEGSVNGTILKIRVGKDKDGTETNTQQITKKYPTHELVRASITEKIREKLVKGYFSKDGLKMASKSQDGLKRDPTVVVSETKSQVVGKSKNRGFSGQYYQRGNEGIKLEVNDKQVRITKIGVGKKETSEIKVFQNNDEAVEYCLKEEDWLLGESYKTANHKFIYNFVGSSLPVPPKPQEKSVRSTTASNHLSITAMTDDAISRSSKDRSVHLSPTKSNRSARDNDDEGDYSKDIVQLEPSDLGPETSTCINVLLAETWEDSVDPTGWYMSEKLDGVRCFWTGTQMFSRNKNRFFAPKWFTKNWPKSQLDGELFIGRNKFSETISAIKKATPIDHEWEKVCYLVFDAPGLKKPFKERVEIMEDVITKANNPHIKCHAHRICNSFTDMFAELEVVNKAKGEGLMLRDPESFYENRRSKTLLKVKTFYDDEATVLGYKPGTGRCTGMVGALQVRNTHGVEFEVGSGLSDNMRKHPPKVGTVITYKYQEFIQKTGKPRFPTFLRIYQPL